MTRNLMNYKNSLSSKKLKSCNYSKKSATLSNKCQKRPSKKRLALCKAWFWNWKKWRWVKPNKSSIWMAAHKLSGLASSQTTQVPLNKKTVNNVSPIDYSPQATITTIYHLLRRLQWIMTRISKTSSIRCALNSPGILKRKRVAKLTSSSTNPMTLTQVCRALRVSKSPLWLYSISEPKDTRKYQRRLSCRKALGLLDKLRVAAQMMKQWRVRELMTKG